MAKGILTVTSTAFTQGEQIPEKYTCDGDDVNPPLVITNVPDETQTIALILEDPDATHPNFTHWVVWNITPHEPIEEDSVPGISGHNSFKKTGYGGPCPPSGSHRYFFSIYALDITLSLAPGSDKEALQEAMRGHILASGELMGRYGRR